MESGGQVGDFLRAHREALKPDEVGIVVGPRARRVAGLRREEVAALAGISPDYYLRLEQGRERNPSAQVVDSLARALRLDPATKDFLRLLAGLAPDPAAHPVTATEDVTGFVDALAGTPVFAHDRIMEVVASNALARALSPAFVTGVNLVRTAFLDQDLAELYVNRDEMRERLVAYLRAQAARPPVDPRLADLVEEMTRTSAEFGMLWARHRVGPVSSGVNRLQHPVVGPLELRFERLTFAGSDDPVILVYHPVATAASAVAFARLKTIAAG